MNQLFILTGASRGMGFAMATQLLQAGHAVTCISRHTNAELTETARLHNATLLQWALDLTESALVAAHLSNWINELNPAKYSSISLINNAAMLTKIAPLSDVDSSDIEISMRVGLEAPMQLTAAFLRATATWAMPRKVLNISSGLGSRPMASQAAYCATKAGLDHFSRCVALDEALKANGAKICSLAPGVIATDMQVQLRAADPALFPDIAMFTGLYENGILAAPTAAAASVLAFLAHADFGSKPVADIRD